MAILPAGCASFNTQPPEGGCCLAIHFDHRERCFNTQPPEGGWFENAVCGYGTIVSTHSRLKAAGSNGFTYAANDDVSTHSRLKAAGSTTSP